MQYLKHFLLLVFCFSAMTCDTTKNLTSTNSTASLEELRSLMIGSYSSAEQAKQDSDFYDISLHMYPIWEEKSEDKFYLYVEQALGTTQNQPYRQRIYEVSQVGPNKFKSEIYKLKQESQYIGKFIDPSFFDKVTTDDLMIREGCAVFLEKVGTGYKGATNENDCNSALRGSTYATSKVEIFPKKLVSWDQGFDKDGKQVWGATKSGYEFVLHSKTPPPTIFCVVPPPPPPPVPTNDDRGYIVKVGDNVPNIKFDLIDGTSTSLDELRGKVVMLQFTASWCSVCRKEMPHIENDIWQVHKDKDFVVIGVDKDEPLEKVKDFIAKMETTYPISLDPQAKIFGQFANIKSGVTRNVIIDQNGEIVFLTRLFDPVEFKEMKAKIEELLK